MDCEMHIAANEQQRVPFVDSHQACYSGQLCPHPPSAFRLLLCEPCRLLGLPYLAPGSSTHHTSRARAILHLSTLGVSKIALARQKHEDARRAGSTAANRRKSPVSPLEERRSRASQCGGIIRSAICAHSRCELEGNSPSRLLSVQGQATRRRRVLQWHPLHEFVVGIRPWEYPMLS